MTVHACRQAREAPPREPAPPRESSPLRHYPALDGLRGVAVLLVLVAHCGAGWQAASQMTQDTWRIPPGLALPRPVAILCSQANHGVQLFFLISAFTLTLRARQRKDGLLAYAARRIARIGPAYWLAGAAYTLAVGVSPRLWAPGGLDPLDVGLGFAFGSAWQGGASLAVVPGGWSVSCEVAFYILLPVVLALARGRPAVAAGLAAISIMLSEAWYHLGRADFFSYVHPLNQLPAFMLGIVCALLVRRGAVPMSAPLAASLLAVALVVPPFISELTPLCLQTHTLFALIAAPAVLGTSGSPSRFLAKGPLVRVGTVSYSMYLVHFAVLPCSLGIATALLPAAGLATLGLHIALTSLASFLAATLLFRTVEAPSMRWMAAALRPGEAAAGAAVGARG